MLVSIPIDAESGDQHHIIADVRAVDLDHQKVQLGQV
jgi:hypothetical protein